MLSKSQQLQQVSSFIFLREYKIEHRKAFVPYVELIINHIINDVISNLSQIASKKDSFSFQIFKVLGTILSSCNLPLEKK